MIQNLCEKCEYCDEGTATVEKFMYGRMRKVQVLTFWCNIKSRSILKWCVFCKDFKIKVKTPLIINKEGNKVIQFQTDLIEGNGEKTLW